MKAILLTIAVIASLAILPAPASAQCGPGGCSVRQANGGPVVRTVSRLRGIRLLPRNRGR